MTSHGLYQPVGGEENNPFAEKQVRKGFVKKVLGIVLIQLLFTTIVVCQCLFDSNVKEFIDNNAWLLPACFLSQVCTILFMCTPARRQYPLNMFVLGYFTVTTAILVGVTGYSYDIRSVALAFGMTSVCCLLVWLWAITTPYDLTQLYSLLVIGLVSLILTSLALYLIPFEVIPPFQSAVSGMGCLIFMLYLAADIQLIMGDKSLQISPEDYVLAAINLYLDIINIFLRILYMLGEQN